MVSNRSKTRIGTKFLILLSIVFLVLGILLYNDYSRPFFTNYLINPTNLHEIKKDRAYRSASLSNDELSKVIKELGIQTVIDLRMSESKAAEEEEFLTSLDVNHFHIPLSGTHTRHAESLSEYISTIKMAEEPILIHCSSGTHRTGVASFIWEVVQNSSEGLTASKQLSPAFGYVRWERALHSLIRGHKTIDYVVWTFLDQSSIRKRPFTDWLNEPSTKNTLNHEL